VGEKKKNIGGVGEELAKNKKEPGLRQIDRGTSGLLWEKQTVQVKNMARMP